MPGSKVGFHHRSSLKQTNKPFKSRHATKGALKAQTKGRVTRQPVKGKRNTVVSKASRRNTAKQLQQQKRATLQAANRLFTGRQRAPKIVALIPLCADVSTVQAAQQLFAAVETPYPSDGAERASIHLDVDRFKQTFKLLQLSRHFWQIVDTAMAADYVVFMVSAETEVDAFGEACLSTIQAQGCSTVFTTVQHLEAVAPKAKSDTKKSLTSFMHHFFPEVDKVISLESPQEALPLLRSMAGQVPKDIQWRSWRPYLMVDKAEFAPDAADPAHGLLSVTGFLRGKPLSANRLIHIPGSGDYQIERIVATPSPWARKSEGHNAMDMELTETVLDQPDPALQDSLVAENQPDLLMNEQTWPTEEELQEAEERVQKMRQRTLEGPANQRTRCVPKGTSAYQAEWIVDSGSEEDDEDAMSDEGSDYGMMEEGDDQFPPNDMDAWSDSAFPPEEYEDVALDGRSLAGGDDLPTEEEAERALAEYKSRQQERQRAERDNRHFPDEVDTPMDFPARLRFQKYRGLRSFRTSPWDPYENLPLDYGRIFQFPSFRRAERRAQHACDNAPVIPGTYITIVLTQVPVETMRHGWDLTTSLRTIYGLLPHERKTSVLNFTMTRTADFTEPIRSKDRLLLQHGFRRLWVNPIFSQHIRNSKGTNNASKFERFMQLGGDACVATVYGPIQFGPAHAQLFHPSFTATHARLEPEAAVFERTRVPMGVLGAHPQALVATGQLGNCDPTRIVAKRTVLSGEVYRAYRRSIVVRFMFFNREDINWFKPIQLHSKHGRQGHIREPMGTHGYMKCVLDAPTTQMDVICMNLYKRMFPKWTTALVSSSCYQMSDSAPALVAADAKVATMEEDDDL
ncbi:ribosome biogenesis protein tsr1 [Dimargaris xerosporica]|nr:ribosome biogenesis protein tsr1 [Dimargaris xerosporica]